MGDPMARDARLPEQHRRLAWADQHAWQVEEGERPRRRRRARGSRLLSVLTPRPDAVDAEPAGESHPVAADHGA